uniref:Uncharacterized protein n=1 Tax=Rhizophagus irregularis (strain DAOM 181602 / DAOM 197198 / MUCL 43194) TaxID=747089 RepID=U9V4B3_RHIID
MNPPLFFDHFKFEYAKKSTVDSFCPTLSKHVNAPLQIEATLHEDTIHHSNALSNLTRNKITALSKRPDTDVSEDLKITPSSNLLFFPQHHHHTPILKTYNFFKTTDPPTTPTTSGNALPLPARKSILKRSNNAIP